MVSNMEDEGCKPKLQAFILPQNYPAGALRTQ
jgi:hypothetical protein